MWNRHWVDWWNGWIGPQPPRRDSHGRETETGGWWNRGRSVPSPSPAGPAPSGRAAWEGTFEHPRDDPDGQRQLRSGGVFSPITRLAEEVVTDPLWLDSSGPPDGNSRVGRHRRSAKAVHIRRCFTDGQGVGFGKNVFLG